MDDIDKVKYEGIEVDEKLYNAYNEVFNGSAASRTVLADLVRLCGYGMVSDSPEMTRRINERSAVIFNIKRMLNGTPVVQEEEYEDEYR